MKTMAAPDRLVAALYVVAGLFVIHPVADVVTNAWPLAFGSEQWRYGAVGAAANYLISLVFGALLLAVTAAYGGHRRTLRLVAAFSLIAAFALGLMALSFALDVLQLRPAVQDGDMWAFKAGAGKALFKYLTCAFGLIVVGIGSWKVAGGLVQRDSGERAPAPLVRGTGS